KQAIELVDQSGLADVANFLTSIAASYFDDISGDVFWSDVKSNWHALQLPMIELEAWRVVVAGIKMDSYGRTELIDQFLAAIENERFIFVSFVDWHYYYLYWRYFWWQHKSLTVAMRQDDCANKPGRCTPTCLPGIFQTTLGTLEFDLEGF